MTDLSGRRIAYHPTDEQEETVRMMGFGEIKSAEIEGAHIETVDIKEKESNSDMAPFVAVIVKD